MTWWEKARDEAGALLMAVGLRVMSEPKRASVEGAIQAGIDGLRRDVERRLARLERRR